MEQIQVINDWYCRMGIELALTELWLVKGELAQARQSGEVLLEITGATAERTWQALAWEVNARLAQAAGDAARAEECIARALSAMEDFEVPLAAWRVHATAAELSRLRGDTEASDRHRRLSRATIEQLAQSLPAEEPLRETFLQAVSR